MLDRLLSDLTDRSTVSQDLFNNALQKKFQLVVEVTSLTKQTEFIRFYTIFSPPQIRRQAHVRSLVLVEGLLPDNARRSRVAAR